MYVGAFLTNLYNDLDEMKELSVYKYSTCTCTYNIGAWDHEALKITYKCITGMFFISVCYVTCVYNITSL